MAGDHRHIRASRRPLPLSDHWWLDLDALGFILGSALVPKARSIAVLTDRLRCYNWCTLAQERKVRNFVGHKLQNVERKVRNFVGHKFWISSQRSGAMRGRSEPTSRTRE
jgi:hypothetical protein